MRRILAFALVLLPAMPVLAARTLNLGTVVDRGIIKLKAGEKHISVRAPKSNKISKNTATGNYLPVGSHLNAAGTKRLFPLGTGVYYASPIDMFFRIKK